MSTETRLHAIEEYLKILDTNLDDKAGKTYVDNNKVDMYDPMYYLDTTAASGTTDGDLYAAIVALGWQSEVIE